MYSFLTRTTSHEQILLPVVFVVLSLLCATPSMKANSFLRSIDFSKDNQIIQDLEVDQPKKQEQAIEKVLKHPHQYTPPVLYALSNALFTQDKKSEATFWYFTAQLRAQYDANRCNDPSASRALDELGKKYGMEINRHAFQDLEHLEITLEKVIRFVKSHTERYDQRWINLYGTGHITAELSGRNTPTGEMSRPQQEWKEIKRHTVAEYFSGFRSYLKGQRICQY